MKKHLDTLIHQFQSEKWSLELFEQVLRAFHCIEQDDLPLPPRPKVRGVVWKGGGVKVFAYVGAIQEMTRLGLIDDLTHVAGSSGGSIFAMLFALGFSGEQILAMAEQLDLRDMVDVRQSALGSYFASSMFGRVVGGALGNGYVFSGEHLRAFVGGLIEHALGYVDASFADLHAARQKNPALKDLYLVATRIKPKLSEPAETIFGYDRFPNVKLIDAFCASLSLPMLYKPVLVHEQDGTPIGYFTDGGLLDNFPIDVFDEPKFCEPHYPLQSIRYHNIKSYTYNPSTVGFSLVVHLDQLDPNLTPFTPRLEALHDEIPAQEKDELESSFLYRWGHWDLIKAILVSAFGQLKVEDEPQKMQTHPQSIVQIYVEGVDTVEFDLASEKFERLLASARQAFKLWHEQFHHPHLTFEGTYDHHPALSLAQRERKAHNPQHYYQDKLADSILIWMEELIQRREESWDEMNANARLRFVSYRIQKDWRKLEKECDNLNELHRLLGEAWQQAAERWRTQQGEMIPFRQYLDRYAKQDLCLAWLKQLVQAKDESGQEKFIRILKAQCSRLMYYTLRAPDNVLHTAIEHAPWHLSFIFEQIKDYCDLCYQTGRDLGGSYQDLINSLPHPPLLHHANATGSFEAIEVCLQYGCMLQVRDQHDRTPVHDAIMQSNSTVFCYYVQVMHEQSMWRKHFTWGFRQQPLVFFLLEHANEDFLLSLLNDLPTVDLAWLFQTELQNSAGITLYDLFSKQPVHVWAELCQRFNAPTSLTFTQSQVLCQQKERAYQQTLNDLYHQLVVDQCFDVTFMKKVDVSSLLALMDPKISSPLLMACMHHGAVEFTQALLTRLHNAGFASTLQSLWYESIQGIFLSEWVEQLECSWLREAFQQEQVLFDLSRQRQLLSQFNQDNTSVEAMSDNLDIELCIGHFDKLSI